MPQYQGVWTLQQQAQAQSNQQWVTDPNFKNTTLLLQADGTGSGSQNQTFLDGSTNNFFITRNGNTTQGSFSPFSQAPGYWGSYQNDTQTDWVNFTTSPGSLFQFTGDYTIEAWIFPAVLTTDSSIWVTNDGSANYYAWNIDATNYNIALKPSTGSGTFAHGLNKAAWNHVALVRSGSTVTVYTNGVAKGTITDSGTNGFANPTIARNGGGVSGSSRYTSNFRIVKGTAVYTSNFTPPTAPLTAISGTSLLTFQSNRFVDNSSNALVPTFTGTPSVQAFGPFAPALQWTSDVVGGSGYFDGSGDWLQTPSSSAFSITGDFTYEGWVYVTSTSTVRFITPSSVTMILDIIPATGNNMKLQFYDGTATSDAINTFPINTWAHVAVVRSGMGSNNCAFYVNGVRGTQFTSTATNSSPYLEIGRYSAGGYFYGYIASLRIVKGQAVYSGATYTVPNAPLTTTGYGTTSQSITASNTSLLLNSTNAGIYDGKMANNPETVGNAQVSTSVVKYGSGSMYFPGATTDYLSIPDKDLLEFGSASFTVEAWVYPTLIAGDERPIWSHGTNSSNWMSLYITSGGYVEFAVVATSTIVDVTTTVTVPLNTWTHIALVRNNNTFKIYINGIDGGSSSSPTITSSAISNYSDSFRVSGPRWSGGSDAFQGFIDDLRITLAARYFANFTPPQQALPRQ